MATVGNSFCYYHLLLLLPLLLPTAVCQDVLDGGVPLSFSDEFPGSSNTRFVAADFDALNSNGSIPERFLEHGTSKDRSLINTQNHSKIEDKKTQEELAFASNQTGNRNDGQRLDADRNHRRLDDQSTLGSDDLSTLGSDRESRMLRSDDQDDHFLLESDQNPNILVPEETRFTTRVTSSVSSSSSDSNIDRRFNASNAPSIDYLSTPSTPINVQPSSTSTSSSTKPPSTLTSTPADSFHTSSPSSISTQHHVETPVPTVIPNLVIHKCCPIGDVFSHRHAGCVPTNYWTFSVPIFALDQFGGFVETNATRNQVAVESGLLECAEQFQLDVYPEQEPSFQFRVLESGWLWVPEYNLEYRPDHYCLETFVQDAEDKQSAFIMGGAVCVIQVEAPHAFDPEKIPVRKCCHEDMVYHHSEYGCVLRSNITDVPWQAPMSDSNATDLVMAEIRNSKYRHTHEVVSDFQTCSGEQRGDVLQLKEGQFYVRTEDGMLWLPLLHKFLPPRSYCLEDFYAQETLLPSVYVCLSEEEATTLQQMREPGCQKEPCVPKCCPRYTLLDRAMHTCIPEQRTAPPLYLHHPNGSVAHHTLDADYNIGFPSCSHQYLTSGSERVKLLTTGELRYVSINPDECEQEQIFKVPKGDFCYERVEDIEGRVVDGAVLCFKDDWRHLGIGRSQSHEINYVYSVFLAISDFFILVSFIVYLTVPDQTQRGLNKNIKLAHSILGRILLRFLFSLFFAYLCLIIIKTASDPINIANPSFCIALGASTYVFFMATFFWLNVLCFELWWKCARQENSSSGRRWVWYQIYAWSCPLIFGAVALTMELTPGVSNCYIKPKFGTYSCFFSFTKSHNNGAKWAYFFGPVAVLLISDLILFLLTVRSLLHTVQHSHQPTAHRQARQRCRLCFKLFLVMGISWLAEIVSFQLGSRTVWYISDVVNCLQGFIIFLIFILKPKILQAVRTRLCNCCGSPQLSKVRVAAVRSRSDEEELHTGTDLPSSIRQGH